MEQVIRHLPERRPQSNGIAMLNSTRLLAATLILAGAAGCAETTPPKRAVLSGAFILKSVNGGVLPARIDSTADGVLSVASGVLTVDPGGGWELKLGKRNRTA